MMRPRRARIFQYYLPVFFWAQKQLQEHKATSPKPLVLGMQAPQGCGKTTLVEELQHLLEIAGYSVASVSIDDFYLTFEDQQDLAQVSARWTLGAGLMQLVCKLTRQIMGRNSVLMSLVS